MKLKLSLGAQAGLIVFLGVTAIATGVALFNGASYKALLEQKFSEKIVTLGENITYMAEPYVKTFMESGGKELARAEAMQLNFILEAAVTREDMLYTAVRLNGRVVSVSSADGRQNITLPETKMLDKDMLGYFMSSIKGMGKSSYEISLPLVYKSRDVGEVVVAFDRTALEGQMSQVTRKSVMIVIAGSIIMSLLIFGYMFFKIIRPVNTVARVADEISRGEVGDEIKVMKGNDEIARMTQSFDAMSKYITEVAALSESLSVGELTDKFEPRSDKDILGNSFKKMILYINDISMVLSDIAAGNLNTNFKNRSDRDLLGSMVISMLEGLKELVGSIKNSSGVMAGSSKQLASIATESQATISQLAETIANISQATSEAAKNSQTASAAAIKAEASARAGSEKMDKLMEKMAALRQSSDMSNQQMETLGKHSEEIKNMVSIIESVADETKLLSFNAAIEAARAGEAGRGFAVVAEEIRNLSEMSTAQAKKISSRIKLVRDDIAAAVVIAQESLKELTEGSLITEEAHRNFSDIVASVDEAAAQVENIAASSQQIAASSEEASASSQEQAASMEELNASAEEVAAAAEHMKQMTDKFTL